MDKVNVGAGRLDISMQIGSAWSMSVIFREYDSTTDTYTPEDISTKTFSFFLRKYKGARNSQKLFNLTNGNGITVPVYSTDEILLSVPASSITGVEEGQYYWELRRTDLNKPKLYGFCELTYEAVKL